jgi:3-oxoacyl-[acyl-carrier protein] reductase
MDLGLSGRKALVFASTRGLGRGIAEALAREGAAVVVTGRSDPEDLAETMAKATGATVHGVRADLAEQAGVDAVIDAALARLGGIDILVLNGGGPPMAAAGALSAEEWRRWFDRMVALLIHAGGRCVPAMRERKWGRLLSVASSTVVQPLPNMALSNALRASLMTWSKTLAAEVAADGVTCNVLLPGRIKTERLDELDAAKAAREGSTLEAVRAASIAAIPVGRYGRVDEFGAVAAFLCSDKASYITGSQIRVDGGLIRAV